MFNQIHSQAIIGKNVTLGRNNIISPFVIIEENSIIGDNNIFHASCHIKKNSQIGNDNIFHSFSVIGDDPQDISFKSKLTFVTIKNNNVFREGVTIHRSSVGEKTVIESDCYLMANSHVAHDCIVKNKVIIANNSLLAGHVTVGEETFISGNCAVHQFVRIGNEVMIGGLSKIVNDVPPYALIEGGGIAVYRSINYTGLSRKGIAKKQIIAIKNYYQEFYNMKGSIQEKTSILEKNPNYQNEYIKNINLFLLEESKKGLIKIDN